MTTKHEIFKTKYYNELDEKTKEKHILYFLDFDTYYQLFRTNEKVFTEILCYNELVDDWSFHSYSFDDYCFLNGFDEESKTYLKNKIYSDTNNIYKHEQRHTPIAKLDTLIDVMYFTHNPPHFLRLLQSGGTTYYPEYIELINKYASDFGFDFGKINYLNMRPKVVFEFVPNLSSQVNVANL